MSFNDSLHPGLQGGLKPSKRAKVRQRRRGKYKINGGSSPTDLNAMNSGIGHTSLF